MDTVQKAAVIFYTPRDKLIDTCMFDEANFRGNPSTVGKEKKNREKAPDADSSEKKEGRV